LLYVKKKKNKGTTFVKIGDSVQGLNEKTSIDLYFLLVAILITKVTGGG